MQRLDNVDAKAGIARALTFRSKDRDLADVLIAEFTKAEPGSYLQWVIGSAISAMPQPGLVDDLIRLSSMAVYGEARGQLIRALRRFPRNEQVRALLVRLVSDRSVAIEAIETVGRLKITEAVEPIRAWLDNEVEVTGEPEEFEVLQEQARKALATIPRE